MIPVIDLRLKFGIPSIDYTDRTCIIVAEIDANDMTIQIGISVDAVSEVLNIKVEEIENPPSFVPHKLAKKTAPGIRKQVRTNPKKLAGKTGEVRPDQVIPFDDDDNFKSF